MRAKRAAKKTTGPKSRRRWLAGLQGMRPAAAVLAPVAGVAVIAMIILAARSAFPVNKVVFGGNDHLSDEELRQVAGIKGGENLLALSGKAVAEKMKASPWIQFVAVRKDFPDTVHILVREAEPFALLDLKGRLFIVDENGTMLEELKDTPIPFLPVISGDPFAEKEGYREGVNLASAVKRTGLLSGKNHVEIIARRPQELAVNIDGLVVKVGRGEYDDKLARLAELEGEIRARGIPVDYIDLRFSNRVIVKPVNEVVR